MLVLTRRLAQTILIGNDVTVTILEVKGDRVRLGVNAPRETPIVRQEVIEKIAAPTSPP
jgi:carbon storage regulator